MEQRSDGGPQCIDLSEETVDTLEGVTCKDLCLDLWKTFKDEVMASSSPYDKFMTMMSNWHDDNPWAFATNQREIANNCTYGTLQAFYLARQKLSRQTVHQSCA